MKVATISCLMLLLLTGLAWAGDCSHGCGEIHWGDKGACGDCVTKCHPVCEQPICGHAEQDCCGKCESCCDFGMDAIMSGRHEIPVVDEGLWELDPTCCTDEYRLLPCREWCVDFTICCPREEFRLICQPECKPQCEHKRCKQDICTPGGSCHEIDTSEGLDVG